MKKLLITISLICSFECFSQSNTLFDSLLNILPQRNLPFILSFETKKSTQYDPPSNVPLPIVQKLICNQEIDCNSECGKKHFNGLFAIGKFNINRNFHLVLLAFDLAPGCGEKTYLLSFDKKGKMIDTLIFFSRGYLIKPNENLKWGKAYHIEGEINNNLEIFITQNEDLGVENDGQKREKSIKIKYIITDKGKFKNIEEKILKSDL